MLPRAPIHVFAGDTDTRMERERQVVRISAVLAPLLLATLVLVLCMPALAQQPVVRGDYLTQPSVQRLRTIAVLESIALGQGYAIAANSARSPSMVATDVDIKGETGVYYDLEYVENYASLARLMSVTATASYGTPGTGASARVNLLREARMTRTSAYVLVRMTVLSRYESLKSYSMLNAALSDAKPTTLRTLFYPRYGDAFVSAIVYGGELVALMEFTASAGETSESLRASVSGRVGLAKAQGDYQSQIQTLTKDLSVRVKYAESGGSLEGQNVVTMTPAALIARVNRFPAELKSSPRTSRPLFAELKEYSAVPGVPPDGALEPGTVSSLLDSIANADLVLREEITTAEVVLSAGSVYGAALRNAASARLAYAELARTKLRQAYERVAARPLEKHQVLLEGFSHYRFERRFGLPSNVSRDNVVGLCDLAEVDVDRTRSCLFGPMGPLRVDSWPRVVSQISTRVVVGESAPSLLSRVTWRDSTGSFGVRQYPPMVPQPWYAAQVLGCIDVHGWARQFCGKSRDDDGVIVHVHDMGSQLNGGACGFHSVNVSCTKLLSPQRPLITELSDLKSGSAQITQPATTVRATSEAHIIELGEIVPSCVSSAGKYTVSALRKTGTTAQAVQETSYWHRTSREPFTIRHAIARDGDALESAKISLGEIVCE